MLLEIQIDRVVYHIMCGYVTCVLECHGGGRAEICRSQYIEYRRGTNQCIVLVISSTSNNARYKH
jgi:hypothetical protein